MSDDTEALKLACEVIAVVSLEVVEGREKFESIGDVKVADIVGRKLDEAKRKRIVDLFGGSCPNGCRYCNMSLFTAIINLRRCLEPIQAAEMSGTVH